MTKGGSDCLELVGSTLSTVEGVTHIVGSVRNRCDREYGNVTVSFKLDGAGDLPSRVAVPYVRDLKPGQTAQTSTVIPVAANASYRLESISGF